MKKQSGGGGNFIWILLALGFAALSVVLGAQLYSKGGAVAVAKVNGEVITRDEVYDKLAAQFGKDLVDDMIQEKLVAQAAKSANIKVPPEEIAKELDQIKARFGSDVEFQMALANAGLTMDELKHRIGIQATLKLLVDKQAKEKVTDASIQEYFDKNRTEFDQPEEIHVFHILVDTEAQAKQLSEELKKGADFGALAKEHSKDPGSKDNGGDLGFINRKTEFVKEFVDAAFQLPAGAISEPVKSQFGFHLIKMTEKKEAKAAKLEDVKGKIQENLLNEQYQTLIPQYLDDLKAKAKIENTLDKASK